MVESIAREKAYMVSNIYLKFSDLAVLDKDDKPFSNTYGATLAAVLTEFLSLDDIAYAPTQDLVAFVREKGKNRFSDPYETAKLLQKAANSVKNHIPEYKEYYYKKFGEVTTHQHKRALALTARKLVRLIFSLLTKNQIYSSDKGSKKCKEDVKKSIS
nr:hypothetical protein [Tepidanaerobacter acetatoxydans]